MTARRLAWRGLLTVVALWAIVTITFGIVTLTDDPNEAVIQFAVAQETQGGANTTAEIREALSTYRDARNRDEPVIDRYGTWLRNVATLQFGISYEYGRPVMAVLASRLLVTAQYVLPGMLLAVTGGVVVGTYAGLGTDRWSRLATLCSYTVFGVPNFWIAAAAVSIATVQFLSPSLIAYDLGRSAWSTYNLRRLVLPGLLVGTGLIANQARFVRTAVIETRHDRFVQLARAKGAGRLGVARHILRVALVPLLSLFLADFLGVLLVTTVVVETVFELPGFGAVTLTAVRSRDLPLLVGTTLVVAAVGILGSLLQDSIANRLDPRVDS